MKRLFSVLLLAVLIAACSHSGKIGASETRKKLTPEQLANNYLHMKQVEHGFDTLYMSNYSIVGQEGYPAISKELTVNVTTKAGSKKNFGKYCASIHDTLIAINKVYIGLLLDTASRKFQYELEKRKYVETKTVYTLDFRLESERAGGSFVGEVYAPGRPW